MRYVHFLESEILEKLESLSNVKSSPQAFQVNPASNIQNVKIRKTKNSMSKQV